MIGKRLTAYKNNGGIYVFSVNLIKRISLYLGLKWSQGREMTHYYKMAMIVSTKYKFDVYLLKFPEGSYIDSHKDKAPSKYLEHHRLNIVLKPAIRGGKFILKGKAQEGRVHRFRPDRFTHKVTEIKEGTRYVLSIGWLKEIK